MIEEIGIISHIEKNQQTQVIWVETEIKTTCGSCQAQSNCGTGSIARALARKREKLSFEYSSPVVVGQKVQLGIPEGNLLKASVLVYMLPLFSLVLSALAAQYLLPSLGLTAEGWVVISAFLSALLTFRAVSRYLNQGQSEDFHPRILSVLPITGQDISVKQITP
jgi:sigma-E factor negative regulatory protein RseC